VNKLFIRKRVLKISLLVALHAVKPERLRCMEIATIAMTETAIN
jgi:hypothetical protein